MPALLACGLDLGEGRLTVEEALVGCDCGGRPLVGGGVVACCAWGEGFGGE